MKAQEVFGNAIMAHQSGDTTLALTSFQEIVDRFSGTSHAAISSFMLGSIYYEKKEYLLSEEYFTKNTSKYNSYSFLYGASLRGLGNCCIQQKDYSRAIQYLDEFAKKHSGNYLMPEVLLSLARCHVKMQNVESAREALEKLIKDFSESPQKSAARNLLVTL